MVSRSLIASVGFLLIVLLLLLYRFSASVIVDDVRELLQSAGARNIVFTAPISTQTSFSALQIRAPDIRYELGGRSWHVEQLTARLPWYVMVQGFRSGSIRLDFNALEYTSLDSAASQANLRSSMQGLTSGLANFLAAIEGLEIRAHIKQFKRAAVDGRQRPATIHGLHGRLSRHGLQLQADSFRQTKLIANLTYDAPDRDAVYSGTIEIQAQANVGRSRQSLAGRWRISPKAFQLERITGRQSGRQVLAGAAAMDWGQKPALLGAKLTAKQLDLGLLYSLVGQEDGDSATATSPPSQLFSRQELPYELLADTAIQVELDVSDAHIDGQPVLSTRAEFRAANDSMYLRATPMVLATGHAKLELEGLGLATEPRFTLVFEADGVDWSAFHPELLISDGLQLGIMDANIALRWSGLTPHEHASSLAGTFDVALGPSVLSNRYYAVMDKALVSWLGTQVSALWSRATDSGPGARKAENYRDLEIECININSVLDQGYAAFYEGLLLESKNNLLISSGYIDFHTELLGFQFRTRRKRLLDWSPASAAKFFEVSGSLSNWSYNTNPIEAAKQGAIAAAGLVWGPVTPTAVVAITEMARASRKKKPKCVPELPQRQVPSVIH